MDTVTWVTASSWDYCLDGRIGWCVYAVGGRGNAYGRGPLLEHWIIVTGELECPESVDSGQICYNFIYQFKITPRHEKYSLGLVG